MPTPLPWQTTIDPSLVQRLMRPVTRPGVIGSALGDRLQTRADRWANRLPLLTLAQRHRSAEGTPPGQAPIVYAQPQLPEVNAEGLAPAGVPQTTSVAAKPTVIQAKFAPGAAASSGLDAAPALPEPSVPRVQPQVIESPNQPDASPNEVATPWRESLAQPELPMRELPVAELPVVEGRSPASVQTADIAIAPQSPPAPLLPIVTAQPWGRPPEPLENPSRTSPLPLSALEQPDQGPARTRAARHSPQQQSWRQSAVSLAGPPPEFVQPDTASEPRPSEPVDPLPMPLPRVRSVPPRLAWGQSDPLVFTQPGVPSAHSPAPDPVGSATHSRRESSLRPSTRSPAPLQGSWGTGATTQSAPPSIVRDIRAGVPDAAAASLGQAALAAQATQTVVSSSPTSPPPVDVEALAAQVERRLARRLAIERERRGWRP